MAKRTVSQIACSIAPCSRPAVCRGMCNPHYQRLYHYGDATAGRRPVGLPPTAKCAASGCVSAPRSTYATYCEAHYGRMRRSGTLECVRVARAHTRDDGYRLIPAKGHPMALGRSHAYEHRVVFFDANGGGPFACHVCGETVTWDDMHVDHLNDARDDNRIENLAAAHPACNQFRVHTRSAVQRRNQHVRWLEHDGERLPISAWAARIGVRPNAIAARLAAGWSVERAVTAPRGKTGPRPASAAGIA